MLGGSISGIFLGQGFPKRAWRPFQRTLNMCPFKDLNLGAGDYQLLWKSFALAAFIQLFLFLKWSDLMLWHCSYITCRALALLETLVTSKHGTWRLPCSWGFGEPLAELRTGPALGTASWQLRVKLGFTRFPQQLSKALCQTCFHLSSRYNVFCSREFIQTKIRFFFFWYHSSLFPSRLTSQPDCELHLISFRVSRCQFQTVPSIH